MMRRRMPPSPGICALPGCGKSLEGLRAGARVCSDAHRSALRHWRAVHGLGPAGSASLRLAVADPPYPGCERHYVGHPDYRPEPVQLAELAERLRPYDGWAWCTSADAALDVGVLARALRRDARMIVWVRSPRAQTDTHGPAVDYEVAWVAPARARLGGWPSMVLSGVGPLRKLAQLGDVPFIGAKPPAWCAWTFGHLAAARTDTLDDLFPGSGSVGMAWAAWCAPGATEPEPDDPAQVKLWDGAP